MRYASRSSLEGRQFAAVYPQYMSVLEGETPWLVPQEAYYEGGSPPDTVFERLIVSRVGDGGCMIVIDETELHETEHERIQTARLASLGFMLAGVCHEVSNPLAATYSMVQILQSQKEFSEETFRKGLATIAGNVKRILEVSRKLNDFSRVGNSRRRPIQIDFAIQESIALLRSDTQFQSLKIQHKRDPKAVIRGQAGSLQQIFYNLALNAAQAMGGHGELIISTNSIAGSRVSVTVEDTGPGIPNGAAEKIFEPFFTTKPNGAGTGLGLAIALDIVHEHGGTIQVRNRASAGACFMIEFPAESESA